MDMRELEQLDREYREAIKAGAVREIERGIDLRIARGGNPANLVNGRARLLATHPDNLPIFAGHTGTQCASVVTSQTTEE